MTDKPELIQYPPEFWENALVVLQALKPYAHARRLPQKLFEALCALHKRVGTDICVFNKKGQIWLTGRPDDPDDPFSGKWHIPGAIHAPSERYKEVELRLLNKEFEGGSHIAHLQQVFYGWDFPKDERGSTYVSIVMIALCADGNMGTVWGSRGAFFDVGNLPPGLVSVQREQAVRVHHIAKEKGLF